MPTRALRAAKATESALETLKNWWTFYGGYDPLVGWWCRVPFEKLEKALTEYATALKPSDNDTIVGDPVRTRGADRGAARQLYPLHP